VTAVAAKVKHIMSGAAAIELQHHLAGRPLEDWRRACPAKQRKGKKDARTFYLHERLKPPIKVRKLREAPVRSGRDGRKPQIIRAALTRDERRELKDIEYELAVLGIDQRRPTDDRNCAPGPCPHVGCARHLYLDVLPPRRPGGQPRIRLNFPGKEVWELEETCSLREARRAAAAGGYNGRDRVARLLNLTEERVRQIELPALAQLAEEFDDGTRGR
jgi:hypothetical protein